MRIVTKSFVIVFTMSVGLLDCRFIAEETPDVIEGEAELTWLRLTLGPLPEREPAKILLAHDGNVVRRVMIDNLGVASTFITDSQASPNRVTANLVVGGKVTGSKVDAVNNALSPKASWPAYLGPNQNFSSGAGDVRT